MYACVNDIMHMLFSCFKTVNIWRINENERKLFRNLTHSVGLFDMMFDWDEGTVDKTVPL